MTRGLRIIVLVLFSLALAGSFMVTGCSRHANEEQLTTLDETEASALAIEKQIAEKEKEKAELQARLEEKKQELRKVQEEKRKVQSRL